MLESANLTDLLADSRKPYKLHQGRYQPLSEPAWRLTGPLGVGRTALQTTWGPQRVVQCPAAWARSGPWLPTSAHCPACCARPGCPLLPAGWEGPISRLHMITSLYSLSPAISSCQMQAPVRSLHTCKSPCRISPWLDRLAMTARATPSVASLTAADVSPNFSSNFAISCTMYGSNSLHYNRTMKHWYWQALLMSNV